jgi:hypothetical protein
LKNPPNIFKFALALFACPNCQQLTGGGKVICLRGEAKMKSLSEAMWDNIL